MQDRKKLLKELVDTISQHGSITLNIILNGDLNLSYESNIVIFLRQYRGISKEWKDFKRKLIGCTRINCYLYQIKWIFTEWQWFGAYVDDISLAPLAVPSNFLLYP